MSDLIVIIVFGWPAVLASVISTTYGIVKHDIRFVILGGVLAGYPMKDVKVAAPTLPVMR